MPFDDTGFAPQVEQDEVLALLRRARERIQTGGLCKLAFDEDGRYCSIGTLKADEDRRAFEDAIVALYRTLPLWWRWRPNVRQWDELSPTVARIAAYNDAPRRTRAEVVALFDRAIARRAAKAGA